MQIKLNELIYTLGDLDIIILEKETDKILNSGYVSEFALTHNGEEFRKKYGDYNVYHICNEKWNGVYYAQDLIIVVEKGN